MRLLEAHDASDDFLEEAAEDVAAPLLPDSWVPDAAPATIGPFRVVREIGRGGMGTVFLALRADGQFEQRIALKLLRALGGDEARTPRSPTSPAGATLAVRGSGVTPTSPGVDKFPARV